MNIRITGIIRHTSAVCINYWKWVRPLMDTVGPLHFKFQVWCSSSIACFWSHSLHMVVSKCKNEKTSVRIVTQFPVSSLKRLSVRFLMH